MSTSFLSSEVHKLSAENERLRSQVVLLQRRVDELEDAVGVPLAAAGPVADLLPVDIAVAAVPLAESAGSSCDGGRFACSPPLAAAAAVDASDLKEDAEFADLDDDWEDGDDMPGSGN